MNLLLPLIATTSERQWHQTESIDPDIQKKTQAAAEFECGIAEDKEKRLPEKSRWQEESNVKLSPSMVLSPVARCGRYRPGSCGATRFLFSAGIVYTTEKAIAFTSQCGLSRIRRRAACLLRHLEPKYHFGTKRERGATYSIAIADAVETSAAADDCGSTLGVTAQALCKNEVTSKADLE